MSHVCHMYSLNKIIFKFSELSRIFQNDSYNGICRGSSTGTKKLTDKLRSLVFVFLLFWNIGGYWFSLVKNTVNDSQNTCTPGVALAGVAVVMVGWYVRSGTTSIKTRKYRNFLESSMVFEMVGKFTNLKILIIVLFFFTDLRIKKNNI